MIVFGLGGYSGCSFALKPNIKVFNVVPSCSYIAFRLYSAPLKYTAGAVIFTSQNKMPSKYSIAISEGWDNHLILSVCPFDMLAAMFSLILWRGVIKA